MPHTLRRLPHCLAAACSPCAATAATARVHHSRSSSPPGRYCRLERKRQQPLSQPRDLVLLTSCPKLPSCCLVIHSHHTLAEQVTRPEPACHLCLPLHAGCCTTCLPLPSPSCPKWTALRDSTQGFELVAAGVLPRAARHAHA